MKPQEDWVDGSWTVDCICGVNFDDGKEMVNCDECGVWVHTWCSRFVKGDDLFACYKCKIKSNDIEVASKLLVTKTLRMENISTQRPFKEIPIEERVHVQGIPGGDLALFEHFSSVFSPQLWKCTGYVPKKFKFQYREFPCWDYEKENVCEVGKNQEDNCDDLVAPKTNDVKLGLKDTRKWTFREIEMKDSESDDMNKGKSLLCSLSTYKKRKEDYEDRLKKKIKVAETEEEDDKKDFVGKTLFCPYNAIEKL